ncbi:hypothetical protein [Rubritalea tangerina]
MASDLDGFEGDGMGFGVVLDYLHSEQEFHRSAQCVNARLHIE